jgi:hypothetical protein
MGYTSDATSVDFDEYDEENIKKVHAIAAQLAAFKPTVIVTEDIYENNLELHNEYQYYFKFPDMPFDEPNETQLLAFEVGRLSGARRIYGIDHKMSYNYRIGDQIKNEIDSNTYNSFDSNPYKFYPSAEIKSESPDVLELLKIENNKENLDYLITTNADIMTFAGTKNGFEGADQAAIYYQRNLRMFSHLNRLDIRESDRVFLLMGAAHTAIFKDFINRSPKYYMVNTFDYLK